ncbi:MAG: penicillin acylase family protein [Cyanobacteria bacterium]|nr:penicillin acylase family protein [Cyanobacteriota bacterium]
MKRLLPVLTIVLVIAAGWTGWWWLRSSLPILEGQLQIPGLKAPVEVLFDAHGVPSVYAYDIEDAWFTAGVMHARDRRWQMELYRRVTMGRLSEVLGDTTIPFDKRFLTLGLRDAAKAEWERVPPQVKTALERYAAGVNAATAQMQGRTRPIEFQLLGFMPPDWEPIDSLAVGRLLTWRLAENHQAELVRAALTAKFGETAARQLTGVYPSSAPSIMQTGSAAAPTAERRAPLTAPPGLEWLKSGSRRGNSNNWVLAGGRTKNGRPILANDPHLQIEFPSVWYEMHLIATGLDVIGVTIPGVPFIALGHNARIAWGMTATGADVQDLTVERVDVGRKRSFYRGEWVPIETIEANIPVSGRRSPLPFEVWKTRNGPIYAEDDLDWETPPSWLSPDDRPADERKAYSLRWDPGGDLATAFEAINRATDWNSFTIAVGALAVPSMNIVYADVDGNIGYAMSGRLPIRAAGDGTMPSDGNSAPAWSGSIEPGSLPRLFNPPSGVIYSANNEIDRSFSGLITRDWTAGFRASRLRDELSKAQGVDLVTMMSLQTDKRSLAAEAMLAGVPDAIKTARAQDGNAGVAGMLDQLAKWDRVVDSRPVVSLYEAFEDAVWRRTFVDEMEDALFLKFYEWAGAEKPAGLFTILNDRNSRWWDDITTVEKKETRDDIFMLAIRDAGEKLDGDYGGESNRAWDKVHGARFSHPLGGALPLRWFLSRGPVPIDGDGTTLMRVSWNRLRPFEAWEHPSWRQLFDVGQWDDSRVAMPAGQSGHPLSPFYFDQNEAWRTGEYRTQPFSRGAITAASQHRLILSP